MSLEKIQLRKLLTLFYLPEKELQACLRKIINDDLNKAAGKKSGGMHFHSPFWSDAKSHILGLGDIEDLTKQRIDNNPTHRGRLYPLLKDGFLDWWDEKRRWKNEPYELANINLESQLSIQELGCLVRVDFLLPLKVGDEHRIIYPYFSEEPALTGEAARLGIWALDQTLTQVETADLRIFDVLRGKNYGTLDVPMQGNEQSIFIEKYRRLIKKRDALKK